MRRIIFIGLSALVTILSAKGQNAARDSSTDKTSYALGADLGSSLRKRSIELNVAAFTQGLRDGLGGTNTLLNEQEIQAAIRELQDQQRQKEIAKQEEEGEAFLAANKKQEGVVTLRSGLQYRIVQEGTGPKPTANDIVVCHYRSALLNGTEFANSYKARQPATFAVSRAVDGWAEALQLMRAGSKWQLFVPARLLRSKIEGPGGSPAESPMIFEVELLSIEKGK